ncbi:MAG: motility protein [Flaviaesturariibacter sp.]|nr:motility protein [Flaviaesturariibacter sp.]
MALLYIAAGINHFVHPLFYLGIMPSYLPAPHLLNSLSGIAEMVLGLALFFKTTRTLAAWCLAVMLVLFMSVHVYMLQQAMNQPDYPVSIQMAVLRLVLQPLLIAWALWYRK